MVIQVYQELSPWHFDILKIYSVIDQNKSCDLFQELVPLAEGPGSPAAEESAAEPELTNPDEPMETLTVSLNKKKGTTQKKKQVVLIGIVLINKLSTKFLQKVPLVLYTQCSWNRWFFHLNFAIHCSNPQKGRF